MNSETITNNPPPASEMIKNLPEPAAWVALDWGDKTHAFAWFDPCGRMKEGTISHSAENLHAWLKALGQCYGGRTVALAIEASRGAVIHALLEYPWLRIYPINPVTSARYRKAFSPSGAKDDLPDARVLLDLIRCHASRLKVLEVQDPETLQLTGLVEARRKIVDQRTALLNRMTSLLKTYYPQALELTGSLNTRLALEFLSRWPDLLSLKTARPGTIKALYYRNQVRSETLVNKRLALIKEAVALTTEPVRVRVAVLQLRAMLDQLRVFQEHVAVFDSEIRQAFKAHPEARLFRDLPGAGAQMAPRLCAAFGTLRSLYPDPASLQKYAGVAPVREKSGAHLWTHWRWQAPAFLRQTFVEWAGQTVMYSAWAKIYYDRMLKKGKRHTVIIRALAFKWIRVLWKCWQQRVPYDESAYLRQLQHRQSPNAPAAI